ncbi:MAG: M15 family metallopeptidase [Polyangiaceae bacterium]|nr:M15 family metallopeptidase [Polyangiaceae bacterium]
MTTATHKSKQKTAKKGAGKAAHKVVKPEEDKPDPAKPANLSYQALDKDATYGKEFAYTWELGSAINAKAKQYHVKITTKDWAADYIVAISVPEVPKVSGQRLHRRIAAQFIGFYKAAAKKSLTSHFVSNDGAFYPRTITGNSGKLSNHAIGTAVDLNASTNGYGAVPAKRGKDGSVRELADFCGDFGLYWGGWYGKHKDGMHFEAVKVLDEAALKTACTTHGVTYESTWVPAAPPKPAPKPPAPKPGAGAKAKAPAKK